MNERSSQAWVIAGIFLLALALLLAIALVRSPFRQLPDSLFVSDGFGYYIYLPSIVIDGDLDLANQIAHHPGAQGHWTFAQSPVTGKVGNIFQIGPAILWAPFFLCAHFLLSALNVLGFEVSRSGFGWGYELPVYCGSFVYGMIGVWYMWKLLHRLWGNGIANSVSFYLILGTPIAAYLWFEPDMAHILSMTLIAMLFYYLHDLGLHQGPVSFRSWMLLGFLTGLIALVRVPDLLVGLVIVGIGVISKLWSGQKINSFVMKQTMKGMLVFGVVAAVTFTPQLVIWEFFYGSYFSMPPNPFYTKIHWMAPDILNYLFSTKHGLFSWTPLLFIATIGLLWGGVKSYPLIRYALLLLFVSVYFNSVIHHWWMGSSFGERRMVDYGVIFALGLGYLFHRRESLLRQPWFHFIGLSLCAFNWILILRYFTHDLPEYGAVSWSNLYVETVIYPLNILLRIFS
ncbi:MAG: hypothetical protein O7F12_04050 [Nitrospirae bacterium]|nr:hypothetical protein [Nitrospirota bacterium]